MEKLYKEIDNKDGSITLVPKDTDFGKIFPFGKQESWDEIFKIWRTTKNLNNYEISYNDWLKEHYNPPTKK